MMKNLIHWLEDNEYEVLVSIATGIIILLFIVLVTFTLTGCSLKGKVGCKMECYSADEIVKLK